MQRQNSADISKQRSTPCNCVCDFKILVLQNFNPSRLLIKTYEGENPKAAPNQTQRGSNSIFLSLVIVVSKTGVWRSLKGIKIFLVLVSSR